VGEFLLDTLEQVAGQPAGQVYPALTEDAAVWDLLRGLLALTAIDSGLTNEAGACSILGRVTKLFGEDDDDPRQSSILPSLHATPSSKRAMQSLGLLVEMAVTFLDRHASEQQKKRTNKWIRLVGTFASYGCSLRLLLSRGMAPILVTLVEKNICRVNASLALTYVFGDQAFAIPACVAALLSVGLLKKIRRCGWIG
jgi:hypothetical protein